MFEYKHIKICIATILATLMSLVFSSDINVDLITSITCGTSDIEFSDFYSRIIANKAEKNIHDKIVVVNVDSVSSRLDIAIMLEKINQCNPQAVAIDILFQNEKDSNEDDYLRYTISQTPNLILAREIDHNSLTIKTDIFEGYINDTCYGIVNLIKRNRKIVRSFYPYYNINGDSIPSFGVKICQKYNNKLLSGIVNEETPIVFSESCFLEIDGRFIDQYKKELTNKIIIVGTISDKYDLHQTPIQEECPGTIIWCNIVDEILNNNYINTFSNTINRICAIIICLFLCFMYIKLGDTNYQNFGMRISPIIVTTILLIIGCLLYNINIYLNLSITILTAALGILILDIWAVIDEIIINFRKRRQK